MKQVYIAHPVRGDVAANLRKARWWVLHAVAMGFTPCAPYIPLIEAIEEAGEEEAQWFERGMRINMAAIRKCDEVWMCGDKITGGMLEEGIRAIDWGIPVRQFVQSNGEPLEKTPIYIPKGEPWFT